MHTLNSFYVEIKSKNRVEGAVNFCCSKCRLDFFTVALSVLKYRALFTAFDNKIGFRCTKSQLSLLNIPTFEEQHLLLWWLTNFSFVSWIRRICPLRARSLWSDDQLAFWKFIRSFTVKNHSEFCLNSPSIAIVLEKRTVFYGQNRNSLFYYIIWRHIW